MNAHNMFVDVSVRAVINCSLPLLHGLCIRYYCLLLMLCRIALFHRTNINILNIDWGSSSNATSSGGKVCAILQEAV